MKIVLFANTEWYLYNFKLSLAEELRRRGCEVLLLSPPGEYSAKLQKAGFAWKEIPMQRRSINPFRELKTIAHLARVLASEKPDIVHNFTIKCAVYGSISAKIATSAGIVNSIAGLGFVFTSKTWLAKVLQPLVKSLFRLSLGGSKSIVIVQNPDDLSFFQAAKWLRARAILLIKGSGVDLTRFRHTERQAVLDRNKPLRLLLAARLLWDKGVREYVEAARELLNDSASYEFLLAGTPDNGNPAAVPEDEINRWEAEGIVKWLGHVNDMPKQLAEVDVAVLPSYREGLPKSLIEAAACGLAIVTTDAPGCREVVNQSGKNGLLVPIRDSAKLAKAIRQLEQDRSLCLSLGAAARERALNEFDEKIVIDNTIASYEQLTDRPIQPPQAKMVRSVPLG